ncbi:MAG TPA: serine/threonine-protein kinase [Kofleriaceae bacterium]|jgi:serine/threonine protein kinase|nr:serine/threonine-protein kinase [Kofleriaceae bacterium]
MNHGDEDLRRTGEVIGDNYVLGALLGIGGMGVVYTAVQRSLDRVVAVKIARSSLASDPGVRERFHTEARAGSRIDHRNVVRVLDYADSHGVPYIVMEHVDGSRLSDLLLDHGSMSIGLATELVRQLLAGLEDAHTKRIVHADVKCDNVIVQGRDDGAPLPRLIDFGIARFIDDDRAWVDSDITVSGTPEYLAPELVRGEPPTFASDVYAVGTVLYELVCGAPPFSGGTADEIMARQLGEDPVPLSMRAPDRGVPEALDDLVGRALAKHACDRFPDASAFGAALDVAVPRTDCTLPARLRAHPIAFSTETTTAPMHFEPLPPAMVSRPNGDVSRVDHCRHAVSTAISRNHVDQIAVTYLELSRALVDDHRLTTAIAELETGVAIIARLTATSPRSPLWRLLLILAALYDGHGERSRARSTTKAAHQAATLAGSVVGCDRANKLSQRLGRRIDERRRART